MKNKLRIKFILSGILLLTTNILVSLNANSIFISLNINSQNFENLKVLLNFIIFPFIYLSLILYYIRLKNENYVFLASDMLKKLNELNKNFNFHQLRNYYLYRDNHITKRKFDNDDPIEFAKRHVYENMNDYRSLIIKFNDNKFDYSNYSEEYQNLEIEIGKASKVQSELKIKSFDRIEKRLYIRNKKLQPTIDARFNYEITYTSPKGRNHYSDSKGIRITELESIFKNIVNKIRFNNTKEQLIKNERAKLTNGLRYKILKRDNFKCQICGSTQFDGVSLHIDHIFPVSKGGKTEESNLRVLCDSCNLGKSDKIET